jgi:hypothetical protein
MSDRVPSKFTRLLRGLVPRKAATLDQKIPGEILGDRFYHAIERYASSPEISTILEIGSSAGGGSTSAFVSGIRKGASQARLYCMEVSEVRCAALRQAYRDSTFVHAYNVSSVPLSEFPSEEIVAEFYRAHPTNLNNYPLETVLGWLRQDIAYVRDHGKDVHGIRQILQKEKLACFELVLIDGSEFTGRAELPEVIGARILMLDDINSYKNFENYHALKSNSQYALREEDWTLRNGYAIFEKSSR